MVVMPKIRLPEFFFGSRPQDCDAQNITAIFRYFRSQHRKAQTDDLANICRYIIIRFRTFSPTPVEPNDMESKRAFAFRHIAPICHKFDEIIVDQWLVDNAYEAIDNAVAMAAIRSILRRRSWQSMQSQ